jgi:hypothetical protein
VFLTLPALLGAVRGSWIVAGAVIVVLVIGAAAGGFWLGRRQGRSEDEELAMLLPTWGAASRAATRRPVEPAERPAPVETAARTSRAPAGQGFGNGQPVGQPQHSGQSNGTKTASAPHVLPGRLEVSGDGERREFRFVAGPGEPPEVTIGRRRGPPERHVHLPAQTVSREHAQMRFLDGRWTITNLSQTNPLIINGLVVEQGTKVLVDGDRIQIGEYSLVFRAQ